MLQATPHCTMMDLYQSYALSQNLGDRPGTQCSTAPTFLAKRRLLPWGCWFFLRLPLLFWVMRFLQQTWDKSWSSALLQIVLLWQTVYHDTNCPLSDFVRLWTRGAVLRCLRWRISFWEMNCVNSLFLSSCTRQTGGLTGQGFFR